MAGEQKAASAAMDEQHHPATVGNTFVKQYYHLLCSSPGQLHRFYKDSSQWCHGDGSQMEEPTSGQESIKEKIMKRAYQGARVDFDHGSIDCQASLNGSVLVMVTGMMTLSGSATPKAFVQTFYLAVQPNGYFVMNDVLRFLDMPVAASQTQTQPQATTVAKEVKKPSVQSAIGTPVVSAPAVKSPVAKSPVKAKLNGKEGVVASPVKAIKSNTPKKAHEEPAAQKTAEEAPKSPKKKAAPVVASPKANASPAPVSPSPSPASPVKAATPKSSTPVNPATPTIPEPAKPAAPKSWAQLFSAATAGAEKPSGTTPSKNAEEAPKPKAQEGGEATKDRPKYYSIYIRDVPQQAKADDLRELFKPFGTIANVNVVSGRGYAFVDFVDEASMRAALNSPTPFHLFDRQLHVDERTERKNDGQRSGFRNENRSGGRGRGGYGAQKGRGAGDRKDRDERRERESTNTANGSSANPRQQSGAPSSGPRSGDRRDKGGRRGGKADGARGNRSE